MIANASESLSPDEPSSPPHAPVEVSGAGVTANGRPEAPRIESGGRGVAILLAAAGVLAAIIAARATLLGSEATDHWQRSVGEEQKRGALLMEGVRFTYGDEGDMAFMIATEQIRAEELSTASAGATGDVARMLDFEARVHMQVATTIRTSSVIATDPRYLLPSGGYDLELSLAHERQELGDDLRIDPLASIAEGDRASGLSIRLLVTMLAVGLAFLFGSLGQTVASWRRPLFALGWLALFVAASLALVQEILA